MDTLKTAQQVGRPESEINGQSLLPAHILREPITVKQPGAECSGCGYLNLESLQYLLHAILWGVYLDNYNFIEYSYAQGFSEAIRVATPEDYKWKKARIAAYRALGIEPGEEFSQMIENDPNLDQSAVLHGRWPEWEIDVTGPPGSIPPVFYDLVRCHETEFRTNDSDSVMPENKRAELCDDGIRFALRAVVCLFGQAGLEELLRCEEAQSVLRLTPIHEFGRGGVFPNISLPGRSSYLCYKKC